MINIKGLLAVASAAFFMCSAALADNAGTATSHAFVVGKGLGTQGFTSVLCGAAQIALGQSAADPICQSITGDVTIAAGGVTAIGANKVTNAQVRQSGALSLIGRSANSTGNVADIPAVAASSCAFIESASTIICGQLATAGLANNAVTNAKAAQAGANTMKGNWTGSTANVSDNAMPSCVDVGGNHLNYISGTGVTCGNTSSGGGGSSTLVAPQGRLTLQSGTPVMTTTQSAKTSLFYDCYAGNVVYYWNGSADTADSINACEFSDAMVSAASAGQVVNNNVYDVWWVHSGTNRICLAMSSAVGGGGGWSSDTAGSNTARGTGFSQLDTTTRPYITNKNSISNCFNAATNYGPVSANQGTYLGTLYATANGQSSFTFAAIGASGGTAGLLGVYNYYNRVLVQISGGDLTTSYAYNAASWREARGTTSMQVSFVMGGVVGEDAASAQYVSIISCANVWGAIGIGLNTTTGITNGAMAATSANNSVTFTNSMTASFAGYPGTGLQILSMNEYGNASGCTMNFASPIPSVNAGSAAGSNYNFSLRM